MVLAGEKGGMASVLPRRQAAVPEGMPEIMEALLTQVCRLTPDQLAPFAVQHLSVAHSRTLLPGTDVNWRKQPVKPSMARLKAYLDDIGFRSTMEEIVVRSIIDQPSDLIGYKMRLSHRDRLPRPGADRGRRGRDGDGGARGHCTV